jgi:hypothetical protein
MSAARGTRPPNAGQGRRKGVPNKLTGDVKAMILAALDKAGGVDYLVAQAKRNPVAFMTLLGKVLPMSVAGEGGGPLVIRWERGPQVETEEPVG